MDADELKAGPVWEIEEIARNEREARERLEQAREQHMMDDGMIRPEHRELIHKLEAEWKHAAERLEHARRARGA